MFAFTPSMLLLAWALLRVAPEPQNSETRMGRA
jgi:hypothetical protein